ncbi:protein POF1B isoform X4 [Ascaphus truei]|uniref:protein POF1B isoform X4 n=1 Tax=Ascaphus truei TaxID=8439 RepID=UPI003F5907F4
MSTSSNYWVSENGSSSDKDNVFYERVRTYSPVTKMVQVLDGSTSSQSPRASSPSPGHQTMWSSEQQQQVHHVQEIQAPQSQGTIRRYIVQNPEQELQSSQSQGTIRRYMVQNPEQELQSSQSQATIRRYMVQNPEPELQSSQSQGTIRRYMVQNPEQETQAPYQHETIRRYIVQNPDQQQFLKGVNFTPGNNVIYEKTIRRVEVQKPELDKQIQITRGLGSVSINEQVQNSQRKVSVPPTEQEPVCEQNTQQHVSQNNLLSVSQNTQQNVTQSTQQNVSQSTQQHVSRNTLKRESVHFNDQQKSIVDSGSEKMDSKYFGELLAELNRKNNDLYVCLVQHVEKIGARKLSDSEYQNEDIESLIPKGASELTKQQIRYLLQMRQTSDKSMRMVLSTFSSLREELGHLHNDLNKLETDKKSLERDLTFKDTQIKEYETIVASVREKNRKQQEELKESALKLRSSEERLLSLRNSGTDADYRFKELEYANNGLQQENRNLRLQISETCSAPVLQAKTDEISKHYMEMIKTLREQKDKEVHTLRTQITRYQHDVSSSSSDLEMRLREVTASLEDRESLIRKQQEELFKLRQDRESRGVTKAVITKKYRNQYPILGLLSDYKGTSPVKETQTIVFERTGEMWKHEYFTTP